VTALVERTLFDLLCLVSFALGLDWVELFLLRHVSCVVMYFWWRWVCCKVCLFSA
jgi:hypothetical protein